MEDVWTSSICGGRGNLLTDDSSGALICGIKPSRVHDKNQFGDEGYSVWHGNGNDPDADHDDDAPNLFLAALENLVRAVEAGSLSAKIVYPAQQRYVRKGDGTNEPHFVPAGPLDPGQTTVTLDNIRAWLALRGVKARFFFPQRYRRTGTELFQSESSALRAKACV